MRYRCIMPILKSQLVEEKGVTNSSLKELNE